MLLASCIFLAILLGRTFQVHPRHSLFVAACLSFSSNPLATRIVDSECVCVCVCGGGGGGWCGYITTRIVDSE